MGVPRSMDANPRDRPIFGLAEASPESAHFVFAPRGLNTFSCPKRVETLPATHRYGRSVRYGRTLRSGRTLVYGRTSWFLSKAGMDTFGVDEI